MKIVFTAGVLLALSLVALATVVVTSSGSGKFQEVGGDFGKSWISNVQAQSNKTPDQANNTPLWGWGNVPKGKELVGGKLVDAPNATWVYNAANWMGDNYVDPYTGNYINPSTGLPVYRNYQVFPNYSSTQQTDYITQQNSQLPEVLQSLSTGS